MADQETFQRTATAVERVKGDDDAVRLKLSFASETPYERWFGWEVLGMARGEYDFSRLKNGAPFLADHRNAMDSILGVVEDARVREGKAYATVRLADTPKAEQYLKLLDAGMGEKISVGYMVNKFEKGEKPDKEGRTTYRAVKWMPYEVSAVAVAADDGVGVGRSLIKEADGLAIRSRKMSDEAKEPKAPEVQVRDAAGDERKRIQVLLAHGEDHKEIGGMEAANEVVNQGGTLEDLKKILDERQKAVYGQRIKELEARGDAPKPSDGDLDLSPKDAKGLSLAALIRSRLENNPRIAERENEVVKAWTKQMLDRGVKPQRSGLCIPPVMIREAAAREMALQEMRANILAGKGAFHRANVDTSDTAGAADLVGTDHLGDAFIPYLWNASAFLPFVTNMDGLVGNIDIPREKTVITAAWVAQTGQATKTDAEIDKVQLTPYQLAARAQYGRTVFNQSDPSINGILLRQGGRAMALGEDAAIIYGSGTNQPTGVLSSNIRGTTAMMPEHGKATLVDIGTTGPITPITLNWDLIVKFETALGMANYSTDGAMFFINAQTKGKFKTTEKGTTGYPVFLWDGSDNMGPLNGYGARTSNQIARTSKVDQWTPNTPAGTNDKYSHAIFGDASQIVCGHWSGVDVVVNPYSDDDRGYVNITWYRDIDTDVMQPQALSFAGGIDASA